MIRHERISWTISVAVTVFRFSNIAMGVTPVCCSIESSSFRYRVVIHLTVKGEGPQEGALDPPGRELDREITVMKGKK